MATMIGTNHRPRKTLADQIDRLDSVIDALGDGLNETVRDVVAQVVQRVVHEAVRAAVAEVLVNVELQRRIAPTAPPTSAGPLTRAWHGLKHMARRCGSWMTEIARNTWGSAAWWAVASVDLTRFSAIHAWLWLQMLTCLAVRLRRPLLAAVGAGLTAGAVAYVSGPVVSSLVSGLATTVLTLTGMALRKLRSFFEQAELAS